MALNVLVIGGSRHIGYYSALRFLGVSFFLYRNRTLVNLHIKCFRDLDAGSSDIPYSISCYF